MAYSDTYMIYDSERHRYTLTTAFVSERLNIDLASRLNTAGSIDQSQAAALLLERVSSAVYSYIYAMGIDNTVQEYILGTDEQMRRLIMDAMSEQVLYMLVNGDLGLASGVDAASMSGAGQSLFYDARIAPNTKALLERNLTAYGVPIVFMARFPIRYGERMKLPSYTEDNY